MQKERATSTRVPTRRQSKNHFQASEFAHIQQVKRNMPLLQFCTCVSRERALIYGPTFLSCTCPRQAFSDAIVRQSVKQEHQSAGMTPCQKPNFIHTSRCGALSLSLYLSYVYIVLLPSSLSDHNACFCGRSNKAAISHMANEGLAQWAQLGHETQKETRAMEQKSHTSLCSTSWAHGLLHHFLRLVMRVASTLVSPSACCKVVGNHRTSLGM